MGVARTLSRSFVLEKRPTPWRALNRETSFLGREKGWPRRLRIASNPRIVTRSWSSSLGRHRQRVVPKVWRGFPASRSVARSSRCTPGLVELGVEAPFRDYLVCVNPCGNFSDTSCCKLYKSKGSIGHAFAVCIRTGNQDQVSFCPFTLRKVSVLAELTLGHLRYCLIDVPPQSNSPPDTVFGAGRQLIE